MDEFENGIRRITRRAALRGIGLTGMAGGPQEAMAQAPELAQLRTLLSAKPVTTASR